MTGDTAVARRRVLHRELNAYEKQLLQYLVDHGGAVVGKPQIADMIRSFGLAGGNTPMRLQAMTTAKLITREPWSNPWVRITQFGCDSLASQDSAYREKANSLRDQVDEVIVDYPAIHAPRPRADTQPGVMPAINGGPSIVRQRAPAVVPTALPIKAVVTKVTPRAEESSGIIVAQPDVEDVATVPASAQFVPGEPDGTLEGTTIESGEPRRLAELPAVLSVSQFAINGGVDFAVDDDEAVVQQGADTDESDEMPALAATKEILAPIEELAGDDARQRPAGSPASVELSDADDVSDVDPQLLALCGLLARTGGAITGPTQFLLSEKLTIFRVGIRIPKQVVELLASARVEGLCVSEEYRNEGVPWLTVTLTPAGQEMGSRCLRGKGSVLRRTIRQSVISEAEPAESETKAPAEVLAQSDSRREAIPAESEAEPASPLLAADPAEARVANASEVLEVVENLPVAVSSPTASTPRALARQSAAPIVAPTVSAGGVSVIHGYILSGMAQALQSAKLDYPGTEKAAQDLYVAVALFIRRYDPLLARSVELDLPFPALLEHLICEIPFPLPQDPVLEVENVVVDRVTHVCLVRGKPVQLSEHEFEFVAMLYENAGKIVRHTSLVRAIWGRDDVSHRLDLLKRSLCQKIPCLAVTSLKARGYRLEVKSAA